MASRYSGNVSQDQGIPNGDCRLPGLGANGKPSQFLADRLTDEAVEWMAGVAAPMLCCISHYSVHTPIAAPPRDLEATATPDHSLRHKHRRYAAMMKNLDDNVGRVMEFLAATDDPLRSGSKLLDNCIVLFTSDNGGLGGYAAAGIVGGAEITNQPSTSRTMVHHSF